MESNELSTQELEQVFVARQPIFTVDMGVWGYELLFRNSGGAQTASFTDGDKATAKVIMDGFAIAQEGISKNSRTFVNFSKQMILDDIPFALPKGQVVELLIHNSATRAFFLKNLSEFYPAPLPIDSLFTIGILSMLDALLNQPMETLLGQIPLKDEIKNVLVGKATEATTWLELAKHIESGQWQHVDHLSQQTGLSNEKLALSHSRALMQSHHLLDDQK